MYTTHKHICIEYTQFRRERQYTEYTMHLQFQSDYIGREAIIKKPQQQINSSPSWQLSNDCNCENVHENMSKLFLATNINTRYPKIPYLFCKAHVALQPVQSCQPLTLVVVGAYLQLYIFSTTKHLKTWLDAHFISLQVFVRTLYVQILASHQVCMECAKLNLDCGYFSCVFSPSVLQQRLL